MIKIDWKTFIRGRMWFGMYWAKNGAGQWNNTRSDSAEIPGWVTSNNWWDWFVPMQKR